MNCYNGIEAPTQEERARRGLDAVLAVSAAGSLSLLRDVPEIILQLIDRKRLIGDG
jgi:hypothetical protein